MRKKAFMCLVIAAMALLFVAGASAKVLTDASGQWMYELVADGGAVITGYVAEPTGDLAIPGEVDGYPVTGIGEWAFSECDDLTGVTIPDSVTVIRQGAFYKCSISDVRIPDSVTTLGYAAFAWCKNLTSATLPGSVTSIDGNPFDGCPLIAVHVSSGNPAYTDIEGVLFDKRDHTLITFPRAKQGGYEIPQGTAGIGDDAFNGCEGLADVMIPDSVTTIGKFAFSGCNGLTNVTIPGSVTDIGYGAFWDCNNLVSVNISDGVTSIGGSAFECVSLTSVMVPDSVSTIGESAFDGYNIVLSVPRGSYAEQYAKKNDIAYIYTGDPNDAYEITYSVREDGTVIIYKLEPIYIEGYKAQNCGTFAYILKDGLATIVGFSSSCSRPWDWMYPDLTDKDIIGYSDNLDSAMDLYEPSREPQKPEPAGDSGIIWIDENDHDQGYTLVIPNRLDGYPVVAIYDYAFTETRFQSVTLPKGLTSIGKGAFGVCDEFDTIIIPDGVTSIGDYAFANCLSLTDATIPESVASIGDEAFVVEEVILENGLERNLVLRVVAGSYAEQYAKDNGIVYTTDDPADSENITKSDAVTEVTVSTAEELINALGSNKRIFLEEGVYNLSAANPSRINNSFIRFNDVYDGSELGLYGVQNMTIQGIGNAPSEIIIEPRYANVMYFQDCSNINIINIKAGHTDDAGYCGEGVFSFESCSAIRIDQTDMYGCGTVGLSLYEVSNCQVTNSAIYECTTAIMYIEESNHILFENCVFRDNAGYVMVYAYTINDFTIKSCEFLQNGTSSTGFMFSLEQAENMRVKDSMFSGNQAEAFFEIIDAAPLDTVLDDSNTFENNTF